MAAFAVGLAWDLFSPWDLFWYHPHILVCDGETRTVQMLDKDGQFLSHLLTKSQEMGEPLGLSYDVNTHRLWVGSGSWDNNKVCVYRYITRQDALTDVRTPRPDGKAMFSSTPAV